MMYTKLTPTSIALLCEFSEGEVISHPQTVPKFPSRQVIVIDGGGEDGELCTNLFGVFGSPDLGARHGGEEGVEGVRV